MIVNFAYNEEYTSLMISLITRLSKKKITEDQLANAFVNALIDTVQACFPEISSLINEDPDLPKCPNIDQYDDEEFLMIVLVGNIKMLSDNFDHGLQDSLRDKIFEKCAAAFGMETTEFIGKYKEYCEFLNRVNHPSKNTLYAMARGVFYKYNLNLYQADYFRTLNTPNPIFLKRMNELMDLFIWNWQGFFERYKVSL